MGVSQDVFFMHKFFTREHRKGTLEGCFEGTGGLPCRRAKAALFGSGCGNVSGSNNLAFEAKQGRFLGCPNEQKRQSSAGCFTERAFAKKKGGRLCSSLALRSSYLKVFFTWLSEAVCPAVFAVCRSEPDTSYRCPSLGSA